MSISLHSVRVFAPATVGNVGPGFDVLGLALEEPGDWVQATRVKQPGVVLPKISGDTALQPAQNNTACVAAQHVLATLNVSWGVSLWLHKGLPIGSGLGSSGASAAAAAVAVNMLAQEPLKREELIAACAEGERVACGAAHRDNVAPALLGGIVLVRPDGSVTRINTGLNLFVALVTPEIEVPTRLAREAIPSAIPLDDVVHNSAHLATMVYALAASDLELLQGVIDDKIAEPRRAKLIPGFTRVKAAALEAGALGCSISGAGPTIFGLCADRLAAQRVSRAMSQALDDIDQLHRSWVTGVASAGARFAQPPPGVFA